MQRTQQRGKRSGQIDGSVSASRRGIDVQGAMATLNRGSESPRQFFRCGRYSTVGHEWYVSVREGCELGPYATRDEAELALANHVTSRFVDSHGYIGQIDAHARRDATVLEVLVQELATCREQIHIRGENAAFAWAKRRLDAMNEHPEKFNRVRARIHALMFFLRELDS